MTDKPKSTGVVSAVQLLLITLLFLTQIADLWTTSLVGVEREGNVLMAGLWSMAGYPALVVLKLGTAIVLTALYRLVLRHIPQYEIFYKVGLAAGVVAMIGVVTMNIIVL